MPTVTCREATFLICPGCWKIWARKGIWAHIKGQRDPSCRKAYLEMKQQGRDFREVTVPILPGQTGTDARWVAQKKADAIRPIDE